jgi:hypothetical protein
MNSDAAYEIVVPLSKTKVALMVVGAGAFVLGGIWLWAIADTQNRYDPLFVKAAAAAAVLFFGLCAIYGCYRAFDKRPGLIIDSQGIVDNSSSIAAGRIPWEDIVDVRVSGIAAQRFITIEVRHPQRFIEARNFLGRMLNAANTNLTGSPINIS